PTVTAGFTWQPDTGPSAYANANNTNPNAKAVVTTPADVLAPVNLNPNDNVAAPTAKITSSAVPTASAANFRTDMTAPSRPTLAHRASTSVHPACQVTPREKHPICRWRSVPDATGP